jgi:hypothetical protein
MNNFGVNVDYVFCIAGRQFSSTFVENITETVAYLTDNKIPTAFVYAYSPIVVKTRTVLIEKIFNNNFKPKRVIFIDDDITWSLDDLKLALNPEKDIVGAFYKTLDGDRLAAFRRDQSRAVMREDILGKDGLIEVDSIGFGFVSINFEIFEKMQQPWFDTYYHELNTKELSLIGEDVYFCHKARDLGYATYGDTRFNVGHEKLTTLRINSGRVDY